MTKNAKGIPNKIDILAFGEIYIPIIIDKTKEPFQYSDLKYSLNKLFIPPFYSIRVLFYLQRKLVLHP